MSIPCVEATMIVPHQPFLCTLLRDYPPEDLWQGDGVYGCMNEDGDIWLSLYCVEEGRKLGAVFELHARVGFHIRIDPQPAQDKPDMDLGLAA